MSFVAAGGADRTALGDAGTAAGRDMPRRSPRPPRTIGDLWFTHAPTPDTAAAWTTGTRLADPNGFTFVVRGLDGTMIGSTSYLNIDGPNRRLEIGATWYAARSGGPE